MLSGYVHGMNPPPTYIQDISLRGGMNAHDASVEEMGDI
jgi:hypothetical protein